MRHLFRILSRISNRLLAFNLLLVFLPVIGVLSLQTYEDELLRLQERSMVQQARLLAASLGTEPSIDPKRATQVLVNLEQRVDARLRIFDGERSVVADSSGLGPRLEDVPPEDEDDEPAVRESVLYQLGSFLYRTFARVFLPPEAPGRDSDRSATARSARTQALDKAYDGRYGQAFRRSPTTRSLTLYSAIPVRYGTGQEAEIIGAVLVTKSTYGILLALYDLRLATFKVVLASVAAAIILSLLVSTTIVRPLRRLRSEASAMLDLRGRPRGHIRGSQRPDEIGDLSRSLEELTRRLRGHIQFIESFASDVSHEFKNPLAAIRTATELLSEVEDPEQRQRFLDMILRDIARLEHLLSSVQEITHIDARLDDEATTDIALGPLLKALLERFEVQHRGRVHFALQTDDASATVRADPDRLAQVFENLLDNAVSFSPDGGRVDVELQSQPKDIAVRIVDQGCGVPPEHRERIFDRFFSYRTQSASSSRPKNGHAGLGLAIVRAIIEGYGGRIELDDPPAAEHRTDISDETSGTTGASFNVTLPRSKS